MYDLHIDNNINLINAFHDMFTFKKTCIFNKPKLKRFIS